MAIYKYNEGIRELIYQFKGCYDYELAPIFLNRCLNYLKFKYRGYVIVPAPSSKEGDEARGFNHVVEIFKYLDKPIVRNVEKTSDIKQADLSKSERKQISNYLEIKNRYLLTGKNILIVDDVKTTGSTLKAMVKLIKECKPKKIKILVLSRRREDEKLWFFIRIINYLLYHFVNGRIWKIAVKENVNVQYYWKDIPLWR